MKKKLLSYYIELIKSALEKQSWNKAKKYGEIALKKLSAFSYSPLEEYLLYAKLGYTYFYLAEYSRSLDALYKSYLIASKHRLAPAYIAYTSFLIGNNFLSMRNTKQALVQFQKVEQYYQTRPAAGGVGQEYGDTSPIMGKQTYFNTLIVLGYCYLYEKKLEQAGEIIGKKLLSDRAFLSSEKYVLQNYYHLNGEYLIALKEYNQSRQSFEECIKISREISLFQVIVDTKIHLAVIDLLESRLESAIQVLETLLKDARRLRFNKSLCEAGLLLSKCYLLNNMPDKAASIERKIKPILNKLDIVWLYEKSREFEQLYRQLISLDSLRHNTGKKEEEFILASALHQRCQNAHKNSIIIGNSAPMLEIYQLIGKMASPKGHIPPDVDINLLDAQGEIL